MHIKDDNSFRIMFLYNSDLYLFLYFCRYVKELLGSLVAAGVVEISNDSTRFHVPEQFKACLQKYAVFCSYPIDFAKRFDAVKNCFKEDGPYGKFITFIESN